MWGIISRVVSYVGNSWLGKLIIGATIEKLAELGKSLVTSIQKEIAARKARKEAEAEAKAKAKKMEEAKTDAEKDQAFRDILS